MIRTSVTEEQIYVYGPSPTLGRTRPRAMGAQSTGDLLPTIVHDGT